MLMTDEARYADQEMIARWHGLMRRYLTHRELTEEHDKKLRSLAPAYCEAVWRERRRYDEEHYERSMT
jgi:hypothetical protein